jgi:hypothetical protein
MEGQYFEQQLELHWQWLRRMDSDQQEQALRELYWDYGEGY